MRATALNRFDWTSLRLTKAAALRMIAAGTAWGAALTAAFTALTFAQHGIVCFDDLAFTAAVSIPAGILAIGPIAAFGKRN